MKSIQEELPFLQQVLSMIENHFGPKCEVVLHDLTKDYDNTIIDIRNGHVTNRTVGGCGSNLGLEVLRGTVENGDRFNYVTTLPEGRILRSSSIYIKDDDGKIIGSICVNFDITDTLQFESFLRQLNHFNVNEEEIFPSDVNSLLENLIELAHRQIGKDYSDMVKSDKIAFIRILDEKGAFLITKSSEKVCELLDISKFTFYNYLDISRCDKENSNNTSN